MLQAAIALPALLGGETAEDQVQHHERLDERTKLVDQYSAEQITHWRRGPAQDGQYTHGFVGGRGHGDASR